MASTAGEIKTEMGMGEVAKEKEAVYEYFDEQGSTPITEVAGQGSALIKYPNGKLGLKFLPVNEEAVYDIKAQIKG